MTDEDTSAEDERNARPSLAERRDTPEVYGAAEDSRLLAEAAVDGVHDGDLAIDVGTGSGYVARRLADAGADVLGTDLNPAACRTAASNDLPTVRANLLDPVRGAVADLVAFNPPYLPTDPDEEWCDWMEHALSGGPDGRRVVEPFLDDVGRVLRDDGVAYLLVSSLTDIEAVRAYATDRGLGSGIVAEESYPFERLVVLELRAE